MQSDVIRDTKGTGYGQPIQLGAGWVQGSDLCVYMYVQDCYYLVKLKEEGGGGKRRNVLLL